jgi:hypothetical protein
MSREPVSGKASDRFECARLDEQVRGAGHDLETCLRTQLGQCAPVESQDLAIVSADDQQGRGTHVRKRGPGEIRPAPA